MLVNMSCVTLTRNNAAIVLCMIRVDPHFEFSAIMSRGTVNCPLFYVQWTLGTHMINTQLIWVSNLPLGLHKLRFKNHNRSSAINNCNRKSEYISNQSRDTSSGIVQFSPILVQKSLPFLFWFCQKKKQKLKPSQ